LPPFKRPSEPPEKLSQIHLVLPPSAEERTVLVDEAEGEGEGVPADAAEYRTKKIAQMLNDIAMSKSGKDADRDFVKELCTDQV
jgi:hypothetical protein